MDVGNLICTGASEGLPTCVTLDAAQITCTGATENLPDCVTLDVDQLSCTGVADNVPQCVRLGVNQLTCTGVSENLPACVTLPAAQVSYTNGRILKAQNGEVALLQSSNQARNGYARLVPRSSVALPSVKRKLLFYNFLSFSFVVIIIYYAFKILYW